MKTLYTRMRDGGERVEVKKNYMEVGGKRFTSARALLEEVTGRRSWTFEKYFRQGRYSLPKEGYRVPDILEWFRSSPGIDIEMRGREVEKLLFAGFGSWIFSSGYDPEEVFQEVCKGILARNRGKCAWDSTKSSFGHYVHMVCKGVVSNYHRKEKKRSVERYNLPEREDAGISAYQLEVEVEEVQEDLEKFIRATNGKKELLEIAIGSLPLLRKGYSRTEIAEELGISLTAASRGLAFLKAQTRKWQRP